MTSRRSALVVDYGDRFRERYLALDPGRRAACARAVAALLRQEPAPGMRVKPILPDKHYDEARISGGDRLIFHLAAGTLFVIDIVTHDDIGRYSRRPPKPKKS